MLPILTDLAAFAGTVLLAVLNRWQTRDLIWSLWLSSLTVGYAVLITNIMKMAFWPSRFSGYMMKDTFKPESSVVVRMLGGLFLFGFFSIHFIGFHLGHAFFLHQFVPLLGGVQETSGDDRAVLFLKTLASFWPFALASAISLRGVFLQKNGPLNFGQPYVSVIKMHAMIFVFIFADLSHVGGQRILMFILLFLYFFPWTLAKDLIRKPA